MQVLGHLVEGRDVGLDDRLQRLHGFLGFLLRDRGLLLDLGHVVGRADLVHVRVLLARLDGLGHLLVRLALDFGDLDLGELLLDQDVVHRDVLDRVHEALLREQPAQLQVRERRKARLLVLHHARRAPAAAAQAVGYFLLHLGLDVGAVGPELLEPALRGHVAQRGPRVVREEVVPPFALVLGLRVAEVVQDGERLLRVQPVLEGHLEVDDLAVLRAHGDGPVHAARHGADHVVRVRPVGGHGEVHLLQRPGEGQEDEAEPGVMPPGGVGAVGWWCDDGVGDLGLHEAELGVVYDLGKER